MKKGLGLKEHSTSLNIVLRIIDCIGLLSAGLLSYWLRFSDLELNLTYKNVLLLGVLLGAATLSLFGGCGYMVSLYFNCPCASKQTTLQPVRNPGSIAKRNKPDTHQFQEFNILLPTHCVKYYEICTCVKVIFMALNSRILKTD